MSFPPGTEMFQFPGFALIPLLNSENKYLRLEVRNQKSELGRKAARSRGRTFPISVF
jgi:hypothetical protein